MEKLTAAEENYIKAIYHLAKESEEGASTKAIALALHTKPASVSDMLRRLADKQLILYTKYYGAVLTESGAQTALNIIRKHRLWEVFLVQKLHFAWDEVHEVAEQLEHIQSGLLIKRLDEYLGHPKYDPHGDPIPDEFGHLSTDAHLPLANLGTGQAAEVAAVKDSGQLFLQYLNKVGIGIGTRIAVLDKVEYDGSLEALLDGQKTVLISREVAANILVQHIVK